MKRRYVSPHCLLERHQRCLWVAQEANERRPEVRCACACHNPYQEPALVKDAGNP